MPAHPNKESLFDLRVVRRNLEKGLITQEQYDQYLARLADAKANATTDADRAEEE
jgi:hypothetical protein